MFYHIAFANQPPMESCNRRFGEVVFLRVVPDTDLAGYPAAGYPANNFAGYRYPAK